MEIQASSDSPVAGELFTLTCTCASNTQPQVTWIDPSGESINGDLQDDTGLISTLTFNPLRTSHGGTYTCVSYIASPHSRQDAVYSLTVQSKHLLCNHYEAPALLLISFYSIQFHHQLCPSYGSLYILHHSVLMMNLH